MLLGQVFRAQEEYELAFDTYEEIMIINDSYARAHYERAEAHLENQQPHWAETFYKRTLKRDPAFALAQLGLAKVAKLRNDSVGYKRYLDKAYRMDPDNPTIKRELQDSRSAGR